MTQTKPEPQPLEIEKGIPIYPLRRGWGAYTHIARKMEVGDSVFIKGKAPKNVNGSFHRILGKGGYRCRYENGGTRVWRIK